MDLNFQRPVDCDVVGWMVLAFAVENGRGDDRRGGGTRGKCGEMDYVAN